MDPTHKETTESVWGHPICNRNEHRTLTSMDYSDRFVSWLEF